MIYEKYIFTFCEIEIKLFFSSPKISLDVSITYIDVVVTLLRCIFCFFLSDKLKTYPFSLTKKLGKEIGAFLKRAAVDK